MSDAQETVDKFRAYLHLSEEMIANATKDDIVETARILAAYFARLGRKYGDLELPDLNTLLSDSSGEGDVIELARDSTEALVRVLAKVTGSDLPDIVR